MPPWPLPVAWPQVTVDRTAALSTSTVQLWTDHGRQEREELVPACLGSRAASSSGRQTRGRQWSWYAPPSIYTPSPPAPPTLGAKRGNVSADTLPHSCPPDSWIVSCRESVSPSICHSSLAGERFAGVFSRFMLCLLPGNYPVSLFVSSLLAEKTFQLHSAQIEIYRI